MIEINNFPKDIQRIILSYLPLPTQNRELLIDIRDFTLSLKYLKQTFLEITYENFGNDIINYSEEEIQEYINYNIFHNLLIELEYTIHDNQYFFCNFISLFMVTREWILKYQKKAINMITENNIPNIENKIRFIFSIMTPESRTKFIQYSRKEEQEEEEDYDW